MKLFLLLMMLFSIAGYQQEQPVQKIREEKQAAYSLDQYLVLDKVVNGNLSAYLLTDKTEQAENYWNQFSDEQIRKESFTCLESGYEYDEYLFPLQVVVTDSGELVSTNAFTPREKLSAPFTCFELESIIEKKQLVIETITADGLSKSRNHYLWDLKSDELILQ